MFGLVDFPSEQARQGFDEFEVWFTPRTTGRVFLRIVIPG
jgi:hypothetical protein